jgi:VWFA-related protein
MFILAIDGPSFEPAVSRGVAEAARHFVQGLESSDLVGVFTFPTGPKLDPTTDRTAVNTALEGVLGQKQAPVTGGFRMSVADLIDFTSSPAEGFDIARRVCAGIPLASPQSTPRSSDPNCIARVTTDAYAQVAYFEQQALMTFSSLRQLLEALGSVPGRKTVVLVSGGVPIADRPGTRPNVGSLPIAIGERAARSNVNLYTLYIDRSFLQRFSAEYRSPPSNMVSGSRDSQIAMRWLDEFSGTAGGALMHVLVGNGESSFRRILRETSAYYLLAVEAAPDDRDGRPREIKVHVDRRGATVRARRWLVVEETEPLP